ncbi:winged helix-turn-helix domain-containing protein [Paenibacillus pabuli]|uniref:winged helix-turn-helix domain-containing protein n=1 Tax=Paenibacillus pabuli TaxID=1472 RepID=UPI003459AC22
MEYNHEKLAKALLDKTKQKILESISSEEKTIKQIAESLNEDPSRLYYHVNQLKELNLVKISRSESLNNLTQNYYLSNTEKSVNLTFDGTLAKESAIILSQKINEIYTKGIWVLNREFNREASKDSSDVEVTVTSLSLSKKQWKRVNEEIRQILNNIHDEIEEDNEGAEANLFEYLFLTYKKDS